jgi:hypothetical protein
MCVADEQGAPRLRCVEAVVIFARCARHPEKSDKVVSSGTVAAGRPSFAEAMDSAPIPCPREERPSSIGTAARQVVTRRAESPVSFR